MYCSTNHISLYHDAIFAKRYYSYKWYCPKQGFELRFIQKKIQTFMFLSKDQQVDKN